METSRIYDICAKHAGVDVVLAIEDGIHNSEIARKTGVTFSHVVKLMNKLYDAGYVKKKKEGRKIVLTTTAKLREAQTMLLKLRVLY